VSERALRFGAGGSLVGVLTDPAEGTARPNAPAIILLGAGIVHRVGPHRLYVKIARQLARMGFVVFRFDFSGIGDSRFRDDALPMEKSAILETREAMDCLSAIRNIDRFVLVAICSGAGFSFQTARADARVVGVSLLNAAGHRWSTGHELARTMVHHYWRMLWSPSFRGKNWRKLTTLQFDRAGVVRTAGQRMRMLFAGAGTASAEAGESQQPQSVAAAFHALLERGVRLQVVYSEGDEGWDYYQLFLRKHLRALESRRDFSLQVVEGANHTFTLLSHQAQIIDILNRWLEEPT
jgi:hypothetical protein